MADDEKIGSMPQEDDWDYIMSSWPDELQGLDSSLTKIEQELGMEMLEVAVQQTISRCKRYSREEGYHFTSFQLDNSLVYFNRAVEEYAIFVAGDERRVDMRDYLADMFHGSLTAVFNDMRNVEQRARMKSSNGSDRFPGDIIGRALINQSMTLISMIMAPEAKVSTDEYLINNRDTLAELLSKHVKALNLGRETC